MTRRTVQAFRHVGFEDLGSFEAPLRAAGYEIGHIDMAECDPASLAPTSSARSRIHPLAALESVPVLHWHGDTLDLPDGCDRLASTSLCRNPGVRVWS